MSLKLEGVPEGWKPVRYGKPTKGEIVLTPAGAMCWGLDDDETKSFQLIIAREDRKGIRAFRNAGEFIDEMDSSNWLINVETGALETILLVDDDGVETMRGAVSWVDLLSRYEFADGRVCGYENQ
jgi:hypothetical protein